MQKSKESIQQAQGMIIDDGFSSQQQEYMKKSTQQKINQPDFQQKVKQQVKNILPPPQQIKSKVYSLAPDRVNGWGFKKQQPNPIPITFGYRYLDNLISLMLAKPNKKYFIVYLGPRYQSTFYAWRDKAFKFPYTHINLPKNIKYKKRPFLGINPQIQQNTIYFDSMFQSGNLDFAVKVNSHQYDLFLRVDSNTRGHFNWFNFTIKNLNASQKYKINICNLQRGFCLYTRGMKPYIKSLKKKGDVWRQSGQNVTYIKKQIRFARDYDVESRKLFTLSFDIETQQTNDEIQIAYCVPYTYSEQLKLIQDLKIVCQRKQILKQTNLCMSLGGLPISLLTVTQPDKNQTEPIKKKCVILCGRVHPGESNGSYMTQGFLKYICGQSKHAQILRKYLIFKIVPMMNPDGVVLGNYRTGLSGRDFNRQYRNPDKDIFPQVYFLKKLVTQSKLVYKNDLFMFLDLHGHSTKKNVFAYGPDFPIMDKHYYETRIFAKILEKQNNMFRYHSCVFKISQCKLATARAILLRKINIPLTYTIQASNGFYHDKQKLASVPFRTNDWVKMGGSIGQAIFEYVQSMLLTQKIKQQRQKAKIQATKAKNQRSRIKSTSTSSNKKHSTSIMISARQDAKIKKIYQQILKQQNQGPQQVNSDDNISQGSSDKQDDKDNLSKNQLQNLFISIKNNNKLGKNKNRKGRLNKIDLLFENQDQKEDEFQEKQQHRKSFKLKKTIQLDKTINPSQTMSEVFIVNQASIINHRKQNLNSPTKYLNQKKQISSKQFFPPSSLTKIVNYKFQQQKKQTQFLQTISIFPDFKSKNKSTITITQFGNSSSPQRSHQAFVISNVCGTPRSIKVDKMRNFQRTLNTFGHRGSLHKKLQDIGTMRKFQNSCTKFTKADFYQRNQQNSKRSQLQKQYLISVPKKMFDRSSAYQ